MFGLAVFLYTKREVYQRVKEACDLPECRSVSDSGIVPYFLPLVIQKEQYDKPSLLGEDLSFCHRMRQAGYKIVADTSIRLFHVGRWMFSWEDAGKKSQRYPNYTYRLKKAEQPESEVTDA
jgi:hypothetical protein